ncbi:hypothetical protein NLJ89_g10560 [Agrocybe chaxingu]|uniref:Uncharacterized protein n=1 Tax=Agrocybe chaxingu TaxID=84603 RepID=A0A9W8MNT7_9AGAR|nr:hypothetical protein NLJ89_g10560 [Agrocybe chaxingu]
MLYLPYPMSYPMPYPMPYPMSYPMPEPMSYPMSYPTYCPMPYSMTCSMHYRTSYLFCHTYLKHCAYQSHSQDASALPGTQACTLDIAKFHQTFPVLPDHKPWLVVQGWLEDFYIDHTNPFRAACASSDAGMIANAMVDIWVAEGIWPILKYEDNLNCFQHLVPNSLFHNGEFTYAYNHDDLLKCIESLKVPWHLEKGNKVFSSSTTFFSLLWDLDLHCVSLLEAKRLKFLTCVTTFINSFSSAPCHLCDVEKIHGSLCYLTFVYPDGCSCLPSLSNFTTTFNSHEYSQCYPLHSLTSDLQ